MASRRVAQSSINWSALAERVPTNQRANFAAFKSKSDVYLRAVLANPEIPPKIDWSQYKRLVPIPGLVDSFQKQFESLKVPYPTESVTQQVDTQRKETQAEIDSFKRSSEQRITEYKKNIEHINSLLPYEQMTMEEFRDAHPDQALDPINRPTFWPHTADEQLGNESKEHKAAEH